MEGGMPRVNIYDISRHAGVSIATVSRVLNNSPHVSEETRRKVMKVIDGCGYVPNAFARGLGLNTMKTIGLRFRLRSKDHRKGLRRPIE